ncbi:transcription factor MYB4-like protein [Tanacetum coccineum]
MPGRTDNEIKNVWHTHLKKRLESHQTTTEVSKKRHPKSKCVPKAPHYEESIVSQCLVQREGISVDKERSTSNQPSSSESSSVTEATDSPNVAKLEEIEHETFLDESFWSETLSGEGDDIVESNAITNVSFPSTLIGNDENKSSYTSYDMSGMDLWYDVFTRMEELPELPEF